MKGPLFIEATFLTYWHIGTGRGSGHHLDALVEKDAQGLPFIPGRALKGVFRDAFFKLDAWQSTEYTDLLFGSRSDADSDESRNETQAGLLRFSNLELSDKTDLLAQDAANETLIPHLYQSFASTAINEATGSAKDQSLRMIEVVIPVTVSGRLSVLAPIGDAEHDQKQRQLLKQDNITKLIDQAASLITHIGAHKNRGFGRVVLEVSE